MTSAIRVMMVRASHKMHLYDPISKALPIDVQFEIVNARSMWYLPAKRVIAKLLSFRPDIIFTDYPAYGSWYARLYRHLKGQHIPIIVWLLGDFWSKYWALFHTRRFPKQLAGPPGLLAWSTEPRDDLV